MAGLQDERNTTVDEGPPGSSAVGREGPAGLPEPEPLPVRPAPEPPAVERIAGAGSAGAGSAEASDAPLTPDDLLERAHAILAEHPVADGYSGLPWALRHFPWYDLELGEKAVDTDVPRMRRGHVAALFCSLHLPDRLSGDQAVGATLEQLDLVRAVVDAHPEGLRLTRSAGETTDARHCGRVAVLLGPAGASALGDSLGVLRCLHTLGVKVFTLSGVSWAGEAGLTRFGEEVVREMNRLGVLVDLSGASDATIRRTFDLSRAPVLFARSAARALRPHPANLPDEVLAELGTAQGLCLVPLTAEQTGPSVRDVADHLDHVRAVAGPECVGLSGTYDSGTAHPQELADASCYPHLVAELLTRGWTGEQLALLTWGNVQRVLRAADFTAKAIQERREPSTARITELDG
ncbi:dipeptidase [Streptomyces sp. NPDC046862]|uniref:dipeptidase n=1 Tax=Streptomyces sp. NPDC046862 TaxID=3154603 RepID=UPI0034551F0F